MSQADCRDPPPLQRCAVGGASVAEEQQRWGEACTAEGWLRRKSHHAFSLKGVKLHLLSALFRLLILLLLFLGVPHLSSPPHYLTFMWPSSLIPLELISGTPLLDLLDSPAVINPASTRQQQLLPKFQRQNVHRKVAGDLNQPPISQNPYSNKWHLLGWLHN